MATLDDDVSANSGAGASAEGAAGVHTSESGGEGVEEEEEEEGEEEGEEQIAGLNEIEDLFRTLLGQPSPRSPTDDPSDNTQNAFQEFGRLINMISTPTREPQNPIQQFGRIVNMISTPQRESPIQPGINPVSMLYRQMPAPVRSSYNMRSSMMDEDRIMQEIIMRSLADQHSQPTLTVPNNDDTDISDA
jgi:hypothetical protein